MFERNLELTKQRLLKEIEDPETFEWIPQNARVINLPKDAPELLKANDLYRDARKSCSIIWGRQVFPNLMYRRDVERRKSGHQWLLFLLVGLLCAFARCPEIKYN